MIWLVALIVLAQAAQATLLGLFVLNLKRETKRYLDGYLVRKDSMTLRLELAAHALKAMTIKNPALYPPSEIAEGKHIAGAERAAEAALDYADAMIRVYERHKVEP